MPLKIDRSSRSLMTSNVVLALPSMCINEIAREMKRANVGAIPIVDNLKSKKVLGVVTDRDIVIKALSEGISTLCTTVGAIMTRDVISCKPTDTIVKVLALMTSYKLRRIIVLNAKREIVGIITESDIATRLRKPGTTSDLIKSISSKHKIPDSKNTRR